MAQTLIAAEAAGLGYLISQLEQSRDRMEASLQQSEERYRDLLDNANDLIQSVDPTGAFHYVNRAWKETLGYTDEDLAGIKVFDIISPHCRHRCSDLFLRILSGEKIPRVEVQFVTKDGRVVDLEGSINCSIVDGAPGFTRGIFRDITDRKRLEEQLRAWNLKLEKKVEEKTRHLKEAQAKLIQSEKMATLGEVIAGATHELNNPIAGIIGAIQMLRSSALAQPIVPELMEGVDILEDLESAARRCQKIVEDLSRFATQSRCNFTAIDLNQVLKDSLEVVSGQYGQTGIEVLWQPDPTLPTLEADPIKLMEVFVNLLQNARNALPDGGSIRIGTRKVKKYAEVPKVLVEIKDDGCGIPSSHLGKIFDPFFTTKPVGKGPGLGLTVSYGIIKRHHGDIDVRSTVGRGTKVTVTLPVRQPGS